MDRQGFWDDKYAASERIWSGAPNKALVGQVAGLTPGTALDLGCGEGADAVWLARQGWTVTGADISPIALDRAARHAEEAGVKVDLQRHDLSRTFPEGQFDLVSAQFLHDYGDFPRTAILRRAAGAVAPGGVLLIESHQSHGPHPQPEHGEVRFLSPGELVAELALAPGEWELAVSEEHDRIQQGPDGTPAHRTDSTLRLVRRE
ncbi:class I SAM-dependent methyltransferase [Symbioplanes lichenis]|uniref:class I SAM-dependent methyltransferase n=1 Tax=Symbioplanes lichenis TaxID=1629072 RepID=UPI002739BC85|nr:class I SAM-dependent methyltransferase [Actinoplanes lichenis]